MACATGLVLVMGMSATVFAASQSPATGTEFTFAKDLKGINDSISSVSGPGVTFEYAVAPQAPNADNGGLTITDSQGHSATVSTGPEGGLTFKQNANTVSYPTSEMISASPEGASNISESKPREVTLVANIDAFKSGTPAVIQPGIYRYKVTETTDPSTPPAGVTNPSNTTDTTRYVDVYVTTEGISGISMHNGDLTSGKQAFNAATYTTKNVAVKKVVKGGMADPAATFAFTATVDGQAGAYYTGSTESGAATLQAAGTTSVSATLGNDQELWICGLNPDAEVAFSEVNTYGGNTYEAKYAVGSANPTNGASMAKANLADNTVVTFTNTLDTVSPTGVIMRWGILAAAFIALIAMFAINRKSKKANQA